MTGTAGLFPPGWVCMTGGAPADDIELAVLLVNSHDALADPPEPARDRGLVRRRPPRGRPAGARGGARTR
jgi:hypothetical protein